MKDTTFSIPNQFVNNCLETFPKNQTGILQEELAELIDVCARLIKACSKINRSEELTEKLLSNLKEEMAHVLISSAVVSKIYGVTESDILTEVEKKQIKYRFPILKGENKNDKK